MNLTTLRCSTLLFQITVLINPFLRSHCNDPGTTCRFFSRIWMHTASLFNLTNWTTVGTWHVWRRGLFFLRTAGINTTTMSIFSRLRSFLYNQWTTNRLAGEARFVMEYTYSTCNVQKTCQANSVTKGQSGRSNGFNWKMNLREIEHLKFSSNKISSMNVLLNWGINTPSTTTYPSKREYVILNQSVSNMKHIHPGSPATIIGWFSNHHFSIKGLSSLKNCWLTLRVVKVARFLQNPMSLQSGWLEKMLVVIASGQCIGWYGKFCKRYPPAKVAASTFTIFHPRKSNCTPPLGTSSLLPISYLVWFKPTQLKNIGRKSIGPSSAPLWGNIKPLWNQSRAMNFYDAESTLTGASGRIIRTQNIDTAAQYIHGFGLGEMTLMTLSSKQGI